MNEDDSVFSYFKIVLGITNTLVQKYRRSLYGFPFCLTV